MRIRPEYDPASDPHQRFALMIEMNSKGFHPRRPIRLRITEHLTGQSVKKSSLEVHPRIIEITLDRYFPDWRLPINNAPPQETKDMLEKLAAGYQHLIAQEKQMAEALDNAHT